VVTTKHAAPRPSLIFGKKKKISKNHFSGGESSPKELVLEKKKESKGGDV